ncbi:MAG TPA: hypothetical protein VEF04_13045 [Blastocatellia bacterium]|nr:hypothetical protein [Blastocatellia bacterium]
MQIIALTGYAQSGKDTVASILGDYSFQRIAFADPMRIALYALNPIVYADEFGVHRLKTIINNLGWDSAKVRYLEIRELLQRFGTEVGREQFGSNFWIDLAMKEAAKHSRVVFSDCRFENETRAVIDAGGKVFRVVRPGVGAVNGHISDKQLPDEMISGVINNSGTIEDLRAQVFKLLPTQGLE